MPPRVRKSTPAEIAATDETDDKLTTEPVAEVGSTFLDLSAEISQAETFFVQTKPDGTGFHMPLAQYWSGAAIEATTTGNIVEIVRELSKIIDPAEVDAFRSLPMNSLTKLFNHVQEIDGVSPGEGSRSATSSRSTGTRSKRTSKRSTASTSATTSRPASAKAS